MTWEEDTVMQDDTYPVVKEDDTCPYWEYTGGESLAPMRECWYCKYEDFGIFTQHPTKNGVCKYKEGKV